VIFFGISKKFDFSQNPIPEKSIESIHHEQKKRREEKRIFQLITLNE